MGVVLFQMERPLSPFAGADSEEIDVTRQLHEPTTATTLSR